MGRKTGKAAAPTQEVEDESNPLRKKLKERLGYARTSLEIIFDVIIKSFQQIRKNYLKI